MKLTKIKDVSIFNGQPDVEVAMSVECYKGDLYAVSRQMNLVKYMESQLVLHKLDQDFNITSSEVLVAGEDPRLFIYKDELYCISWTFNHNKKDLDIFLYNITTRTKTSLHNADLRYNGKNWTPFVYNGSLYFIYALQPLVILKYVEPDLVKLHYSEVNTNHINSLSFGSGGIGNIRAGSQSIYKNGALHLFSRTGTPNPHIIHFTTLDPVTFKTDTICLEPDRRSGVHDPYGYFQYQGKEYISTTESDSLWSNNTKWFKNSIYQVN